METKEHVYKTFLNGVFSEIKNQDHLIGSDAALLVIQILVGVLTIPKSNDGIDIKQIDHQLINLVQALFSTIKQEALRIFNKELFSKVYGEGKLIS